MQKIKLTFDDMHLEAVRLPDATWLCYIQDTGFNSPQRTDGATEDRMEFIVRTDMQMGAVVALCVGGDNYREDITTALYEIAEAVVGKFPRNLRPIP